MKIISLEKSSIILLAIIFFVAVFVRFYNFSNRINFGPEQALSLTITGQYLTEKVTLLGLPSTQRITSAGHIIYFPPLFNYSLMPIEFLANYDPVPITGYFTILNLITGLVIFAVFKKLFNIQVAFFSLILFLFNSYMIYHSMFIWIVNFLPLVGILTFYFFCQFRILSNFGKTFILGLLSGIGFSLEYLYLPTAVLVAILVFWFSRQKMKDIILFLTGFFIVLTPVFIFDLKHDYYYTRTLLQYIFDTIANPSQSKFAYYHFLQFWPLATLVGGIILSYIFRRQKIIAIALIIIFIAVNLMSEKVSFSQALGMSPGLNYPKVEQAAFAIARDNPDDFNVATLMDFDSRALPLRYLLQYKFHLYPRGVEDYQNSQAIYVFANSGYDFEKAIAWEVKVFQPFKVDTLKVIDNRYTVYKLLK